MEINVSLESFGLLGSLGIYREPTETFLLALWR
jgi:hypothetical protein